MSSSTGGVWNNGDVATAQNMNYKTLAIQSGAPINPITGQQWYDNVNNILKQWNGTAWVAIAQSVLLSTAIYTVVQYSGLIRAVPSYEAVVNNSSLTYSGTDASTIIQNAISALTPSRTWYERVVVKGGPYTLNSTLTLPAYTVLDFKDAHLVQGVANNGNPMITATSVNNVAVIVGLFDGNRMGGLTTTGSTGGGNQGVFFSNVDYFYFGGGDKRGAVTQVVSRPYSFQDCRFGLIEKLDFTYCGGDDATATGAPSCSCKTNETAYVTTKECTFAYFPADGPGYSANNPANYQQTTLSANCVVGATSITVTSNTGLYAGNQIELNAGGATDEYLILVQNTSGTTWTVKRTGGGGTIYAHVSTENVNCWATLTAGPAAGATTIAVSSSAPLSPGRSAILNFGGNNEEIVLTTVNLGSKNWTVSGLGAGGGLQYAHSIGEQIVSPAGVHDCYMIDCTSKYMGWTLASPGKTFANSGYGFKMENFNYRNTYNNLHYVGLGPLPADWGGNLNGGQSGIHFSGFHNQASNFYVNGAAFYGVQTLADPSLPYPGPSEGHYMSNIRVERTGWSGLRILGNNGNYSNISIKNAGQDTTQTGSTGIKRRNGVVFDSQSGEAAHNNIITNLTVQDDQATPTILNYVTYNNNDPNIKGNKVLGGLYASGVANSGTVSVNNSPNNEFEQVRGVMNTVTGATSGSMVAEQIDWGLSRKKRVNITFNNYIDAGATVLSFPQPFEHLPICTGNTTGMFNTGPTNPTLTPSNIAFTSLNNSISFRTSSAVQGTATSANGVNTSGSQTVNLGDTIKVYVAISSTVDAGFTYGVHDTIGTGYIAGLSTFDSVNNIFLQEWVGIAPSNSTTNIIYASFNTGFGTNNWAIVSAAYPNGSLTTGALVVNNGGPSTNPSITTTTSATNQYFISGIVQVSNTGSAFSSQTGTLRIQTTASSVGLSLALVDNTTANSLTSITDSVTSSVNAGWDIVGGLLTGSGINGAVILEGL